jgi:hypothetical protein
MLFQSKPHQKLAGHSELAHRLPFHARGRENKLMSDTLNTPRNRITE